jgi:outer membrane murein-binding lipoprotein Lpp
MTNKLTAVFIATTLTGLLLSGCRSEKPKEPQPKEAATQAIQTAAEKAHEVIDKTAATSQTIAEKAEEIKATARQAATDISATILKDSQQDPEKSEAPKSTDVPQ